MTAPVLPLRTPHSRRGRAFRGLLACLAFVLAFPSAADSRRDHAEASTEAAAVASVYLRIGFGHAQSQPLLSRVRYGLALRAWADVLKSPSGLVAMAFAVAPHEDAKTALDLGGLHVGGINILATHLRARPSGLFQPFRVIDSGRLAAELSTMTKPTPALHLQHDCAHEH